MPEEEAYCLDYSHHGERDAHGSSALSVYLAHIVCVDHSIYARHEHGYNRWYRHADYHLVHWSMG